MIPNIVQGERMGGLLSYLVGEGRANEHTNPHLVGGDPMLMSWYSHRELTAGDATDIARYLDRATSQRETPVPGGHVFHCSLSLHEREGILDDSEWEKIAGEFVDRMGMGSNLDGPNHSWVALRHGLSKNGNDHIHLVVNLVRDDGAKADMHYSYVRAQKIARELEVDFGLEQLESERAGRAERGYKAGEREAHARRSARAKFIGQNGNDKDAWINLPAGERAELMSEFDNADLPRNELATRVRACAQASRSEAEFVRRARRGGLLVRPRYAQGRTDVVTGYSVALRPARGERAIWFGGGRLARDLTLTRLREGWPDTPQGASEAVAEWNRAATKRPPSLKTEPGEPISWTDVSRDVDRLTRRLINTPTDSPEWISIARQTSGVLSAWAVATEDQPGPLTKAARSLARVGQTRRRPETRTVNHPALTALSILAIGTTSRSTSQALMWMQLSRLATLVVQSRMVAQQARLARDIRATTLATLTARGAPVHTTDDANTPNKLQVVNTTSSHDEDAARRHRLSLGQGPQQARTNRGQRTWPYPRRTRDNDYERE
ncbi:relaxase/mobilization nuclease domain-containing protein [Trueperella pyogenes]